MGALSGTKVIILNGVGSVGKSTTARAVQTLSALPFLHVSMDAFIDMLPVELLDHADGFRFETTVEDGLPSVRIHTGAVAARAMRGMRRAIAALAAAGSHLLVDAVMLGEGEAQDYRDLLGHFDLSFVGLFAPLDILERRERDRGDRQLGLAKWQFDRVHRDICYDLEIDTAASGPVECAEIICRAFGIQISCTLEDRAIDRERMP